MAGGTEHGCVVPAGPRRAVATFPATDNASLRPRTVARDAVLVPYDADDSGVWFYCPAAQKGGCVAELLYAPRAVVERMTVTYWARRAACAVSTDARVMISQALSGLAEAERALTVAATHTPAACEVRDAVRKQVRQLAVALGHLERARCDRSAQPTAA